MKYGLTIFKNIFDTNTKRSMYLDGYSQLKKLLYDLSEQPAVKGGPNSAVLFSPAIYEEGTTRSNKTVECWAGWAAVDCDQFVVDCSAGIEPLKDYLSEICGEFEFICYSTASSTHEHPKFRLVFPLTERLTAPDIRHFWFALNKQIKDIGDVQTKDESRMFYIPGQYPEAYNFIFTNSGKVMDAKELMDKWEYTRPTGLTFLERLPEGIKKEVIAWRKEQMTNTDVKWSSYHDCPFFPKKLSREYKAINGSGWYHKMYQIMVATAASAIARDYPITAKEIADMCLQLDSETGNWYDDRPIEREADGAIEYVYRN